MPGYLPTREHELVAWLNNFQTVANADISSLGITLADLTVITDDTTLFTNDLSNVTATKAAHEGAVKAKDVSMKAVSKDVRALVKRIQNYPGVSDALKAQLGITVPSPVINRTPPSVPTALQARPEAIGINTLKWNRSGNKSTTQYVILAKTLTNGAQVSDDADWLIVGQTTRTRFDHKNVTPGVPMAYKVQAARADQASVPSFPATVYGG